MITTGAKYFFGLAALALFGAVAYGFGAHGGLSGVLTLGLYGGVGDHAGLAVLLGAFAAAAFLGGMAVAFRDADPDAVRAVAAVDTVPEVQEPRTNSFWPVLGAAAAGCAVIGLVVSAQLFVFAILVGVVVLLEWMVSSWADRSTGDPAVNRRIRNRIMNPIEVPVFGAIAAFALVLSLSRVLLAVSENASTAVAICFGVVVLAIGFLLASRPKSLRTIATVLCVLAALGVITAGVVSAAQGSRNYERDHEHIPFKPLDRNQPTLSTLPE